MNITDELENDTLKNEEEKDSHQKLHKNAFKIRLAKGVKLTDQHKKALKKDAGCFYSWLHNQYVCPIERKDVVANYFAKQNIASKLEEIIDLDVNKPKKTRNLSLRLEKLEEDHFNEEQALRDIVNKYRKNSSPEDFCIEPIKESKTETEYLLEMEYYKKYHALREKKQEIDQLRNSIRLHETEEQESVLLNASDTWPFTVLGLNYNMEVLLSFNGKVVKWSVEKFSETRIKALFGKECSTWQETRDAIIYEAHNKGMIDDEIPLKCGVWKIKKRWLIISGRHAALVENGQITELKEPVFDGKILEMDGKDWLDWSSFIENFGKIQLNHIFGKIHQKVSAWNWLDPSMVDYATSFIFLSPVQQAMTWRPWIYITGERGTGKSTFFEDILQMIYGPMVERLDKSTAHATAQTIGNTGKIPVFDEFEKHKHIPDILELSKIFNKGGNKTSGTPGQTANKYELHHLAWYGSIYLPRQLGQDAAQESRMVKLELKKLSNSTPLLEKVDEKEASILATEIVSAIIANWEDIESGAQQINKRRKEICDQIPGVEIRTVENFMYASALLNKARLINNEYHTVPIWNVRKIEDDGDRIINTILSSIVKVGLDSYSIREMLDLARNAQGSHMSKELEKVGLKFTAKDGTRYLAFKADNITRFLLKDTDFREADIQAPLSRIEGAKPSEQVKGMNRCVLIPVTHFGFDSATHAT